MRKEIELLSLACICALLGCVCYFFLSFNSCEASKIIKKK